MTRIGRLDEAGVPRQQRCPRPPGAVHRGDGEEWQLGVVLAVLFRQVIADDAPADLGHARVDADAGLHRVLSGVKRVIHAWVLC